MSFSNCCEYLVPQIFCFMFFLISLLFVPFAVPTSGSWSFIQVWLIAFNKCSIYTGHALSPVLLPGKSYGRRSLEGCSPWVAEGQTGLSDFTFTFHFHALEKEMATHSSVLAWKIPGMEEHGGLPSMGLHRV